MATLRACILFSAILCASCATLGEQNGSQGTAQEVTNPKEVMETEVPSQQSAPENNEAAAGVVPTADPDMAEIEKQGQGQGGGRPSTTERHCIQNGHACEILLGHRSCCFGRCVPPPSAFFQAITLGGFGTCHA